MADTKMSEEQVAELKQAFNEFDVDGGGEGYFMKYSCSFRYRNAWGACLCLMRV